MRNVNFFYERQNARGNWLSSQIDVGYIQRVAYVSSVQSARASAMDVRFTSARQLSLIYCASGDALSRSIRRIYSFRPSVGADSDKILKNLFAPHCFVFCSRDTLRIYISIAENTKP